MSLLVPGKRGWSARAQARISESIDRLIAVADASSADLVLVAPPFASPDRPSLGLHLLAAASRKVGVKACVVYANLAYAAVIGPKLYRVLCHTPTEQLVGERLFRGARYGMASVAGDVAPPTWRKLRNPSPPPFKELQAISALYVQELATAIAALPGRFLGLSTVFEQTLASLSIISAVKQLDPTKVTLLGGANVDGMMGEAMAALEPAIDHVFTGEADTSLPQFLLNSRSGQADIPRLVKGEIATDLDRLEPPCFDEFFLQFAELVQEPTCEEGLDSGELRLPYESSRGCWWGEKHHCTFCGLNANGMQHRTKNADKVLSEISQLSERHEIDRILMVDNIMPHGYFSTLLPNLKKSEKKLSIFYEQKANISLERMALLSAAGVNSIQPGIESLSSALLQRMRKGTTAQINIDCMRFARSSGIAIVWNLLCDFPGDEADDYDGIIALAPLLHHLQPPGGVGGLSIDRFSPYYDDPEAFGIRDVRPLDAYKLVFPNGDLHRLAYHFAGDYHSSIRSVPGLHKNLERAIQAWDAAWADESVPILSAFEIEEDQYIVVDTRSCSQSDVRMITRTEAHNLLRGSRTLTPDVKIALDLGQLAEIDGHYGPIACSPLDASSWN